MNVFVSSKLKYPDIAGNADYVIRTTSANDFFAQQGQRVGALSHSAIIKSVNLLFFCRPGTVSVEEKNWSICAVIEADENGDEIYLSLWANGLCGYFLSAKDYRNYNYTLKKF